MEKVLDYKSSNRYFVIAKLAKIPGTNWEVYNFFDKSTLSWVDEARLSTLFSSKEELTSFRNKNRAACKGGNMRPVWAQISGV